MRKRKIVVAYDNGLYEIIGATRRNHKRPFYFQSKEVFGGVIVKKTRYYNVIKKNKHQIITKEVKANEII